MNRTAAQATLAAWHAILADPDDRVTYGTAVQALAAAADYFAAECYRLEAGTPAEVGVDEPYAWDGTDE